MSPPDKPAAGNRREEQNPAAPGGARPVGRSEMTRAPQWYRRARATERGGKDTGSRSALIVPWKQGNSTLRGPCGGKRGVELRNRWEET
jgi:hypothetical protein